jgi:hypothetical protein
MFHDSRGPIEHFSWGRFVICGEEHGKVHGSRVGKGKDIRLIGKKVSRWKEREGHSLTPHMITGIFDSHVDILIIGAGVEGLVECSDKVIQSVRERGIERVIVKNTPEACKLYNDLFHDGKSVALLAHGTC